MKKLKNFPAFFILVFKSVSIFISYDRIAEHGSLAGEVRCRDRPKPQQQKKTLVVFIVLSVNEFPDQPAEHLTYKWTNGSIKT